MKTAENSGCLGIFGQPSYVSRQVFSQHRHTFDTLLFSIIKWIGHGGESTLYSVKSAILDKKKNENALLWKPGIVDWLFMRISEKVWRSMPFELGSDYDFSKIYSM